MQYLKDNHYKVIALRDLAEYIDPATAAQLPPTSRAYKPNGTEPLASEEKAAGGCSGYRRSSRPSDCSC